MLKQYQGLLTLIGRLLIVPIFLGAGYNHIKDFQQTSGMLAGKLSFMPASVASFLLMGACAFLVLGGLSLLLGFQARIGALLIIIFLLAVTPLFHAFWNIPEDQVRMQMINFQKNFAIVGGLLFIMAYGPGPFSFDEARTRRLK